MDILSSDHGIIINHLEELMETKGVSKNTLCHSAQLERTQLNKLCKNQTTRLDTDVLARICNAIPCSIHDLLEYVPPCSGVNYSVSNHHFDSDSMLKVAESQIVYPAKPDHE